MEGIGYYHQPPQVVAEEHVNQTTTLSNGATRRYDLHHYDVVEPEPIPVYRDLAPVPLTTHHVVHLPVPVVTERTVMQPVERTVLENVSHTHLEPVSHTVAVPTRRIVHVPTVVDDVEYQTQIDHVPHTYTEQVPHTYTEQVPTTVRETATTQVPVAITATHW
jgi:hypothetical protein